MKPSDFLRRSNAEPRIRRREPSSRDARQPPQQRVRRSAKQNADPNLVWSQGRPSGERASLLPAPLTTPSSEPRRRNRRKPNIPRILLRALSLLLILECVAALLRSPRLWVRTVRVEGNQTVTAARLFERMGLRPRTNIVLLRTDRIRAGVEREPVVAHAEVSRRLPDRIVVRVRERTPWAVVKTNGICYTVDTALVPFRKDRMPRPNLPLIVLASEGAAPRLGKRIQTYGIQPASRCLLWTAAHPRFPLTRIVVDRSGKLCLNRENGAEVQLGTGKDLDKKLNALALLLEQRADVRAGDFAYINLYAFDAPAVQPRAASETPPYALEPSSPHDQVVP